MLGLAISRLLSIDHISCQYLRWNLSNLSGTSSPYFYREFVRSSDLIDMKKRWDNAKLLQPLTLALHASISLSLLEPELFRSIGHKNIQGTQIYIHIDWALFRKDSSDEFQVKVARKPEEITDLLEAGFEYILQKDNPAYFRKRKWFNGCNKNSRYYFASPNDGDVSRISPFFLFLEMRRTLWMPLCV